MSDAHANFAYTTVLTPPAPATSGTTVVVASGTGTVFPTAPFNATICPAGANPLKSNAEIVRVTGIATDTLTITRAQEGSTARSVVAGDQIFAGPTNKTFTDIESAPIGTVFSNDFLNNPATTAPVANTLYVMGVPIPANVTLTGIKYLVGSSAGNVLVSLYNSAGTRVAVSASTAVGGGLTVQTVPFTGTFAAVAGFYYLGIQFSLTTVTAPQGIPCIGSATAQGSFAAPASITPPTAATSNNVYVLTTY